MSLIKTIHDKIQPLKLFAVEVLIKSKTLNRYIGKTVVSTEARSSRLAIINLENDLRMHIGEAKVAKRNEPKVYRYRITHSGVEVFKVSDTEVLSVAIFKTPGSVRMIHSTNKLIMEDAFDNDITGDCTRETFELKYTEAMKQIEI